MCHIPSQTIIHFTQFLLTTRKTKTIAEDEVGMNVVIWSDVDFLKVENGKFEMCVFVFISNVNRII